MGSSSWIASPERGEETGRNVPGHPEVRLLGTLTEPLEWANSTLVTQGPVEAVCEMKATGSTSLRTLGSLTPVPFAAEHRTRGSVRVGVFPVITASTGSDRICDGYRDVVLEMVESRLFGGRSQLLEYVPTVLAGPHGTATSEGDGRTAAVLMRSRACPRTIRGPCRRPPRTRRRPRRAESRVPRRPRQDRHRTAGPTGSPR